ncbi:hypothetical protein HNQ34_003009 [Anoxybacillus tepidamans]|uniref:Type I restriction modification DNA specificity domain-containing protein n=1 Tax=Anoxybacteroides tepidamans TaxID=265948 RepID=A0A7W8MWF6_9BACL|nr:hypothetical protein [Anoxybacillus tepidamans]MBB5325903.1 hypothetical protein [Anoxybacillus tepidamans]
MENKKTIPLRMLCKEITDGTRNATEFVDYKTNVPYIRLSNIEGGKLVQKEMKYLFDLEEIEEKAIVRKGDILISKIISLPKLALVDEVYDGAVISPDIIKIRPNDQQTQEKLKRFFSSDIGMLSLKKMVVPSILPKISLKQLGDLEIIIDEETEGDIRNEQTDLKQKLYSLYELEFNHINKSLTTECWVEKQFLVERLDVNYYRYYTSDAFKLLKHKIKNEQWTQLKDICEIVTYTVSPKDFRNKEIRYIGFKNIDANACRIVSAETISFEKVKSRARYELKENDVLLGVVGPHIGEENHPLAFVTKEYEGALASSAFIVLRNFKYGAAYLLWCLFHPLVRSQLKATRRGQLQMIISIEDLKRIYLPVESPEKIALIENVVKKFFY